jgi:hypothetical protein
MPGCRIATWNSEQLLADKYLGYFDGIGFDRAERVLIYSGIHRARKSGGDLTYTGLNRFDLRVLSEPAECVH